jgi:hypothetical protein
MGVWVCWEWLFGLELENENCDAQHSTVEQKPQSQDTKTETSVEFESNTSLQALIKNFTNIPPSCLLQPITPLPRPPRPPPLPPAPQRLSSVTCW